MKKKYIIGITFLVGVLTTLLVFYCVFSYQKYLDAKKYMFSFQNEVFEEPIPEWQDIQFGTISLSIPYSPEWRIRDWRPTNIGLSVFDSSKTDNGNVMSFGKPRNQGMSFVREYHLVQEKNNIPPEIRLGVYGSVCGEAEEKTIGDLHGILLYDGGAKGCNIGFTFDVGPYTYTIYRHGQIKESKPTLHEEMEKIIKSVHSIGIFYTTFVGE